MKITPKMALNEAGTRPIFDADSENPPLKGVDSGLGGTVYKKTRANHCANIQVNKCAFSSVFYCILSTDRGK